MDYWSVTTLLTGPDPFAIFAILCVCMCVCSYVCVHACICEIYFSNATYLAFITTEIVDVNMISPSTTVYGQSTILLYCVAYGLPAAPSITWQFSGNGTSILYDVDQVLWH